jgi:hypothetical protein
MLKWFLPIFHISQTFLLIAFKEFLLDLEYKCDLCEKKLNIYDARQCSHCGGKGDQPDPFYCVTCKEEGCGKEGRGTRFCNFSWKPSLIQKQTRRNNRKCTRETNKLGGST